jgi:hypothetical protein
LHEEWTRAMVAFVAMCGLAAMALYGTSEQAASSCSVVGMKGFSGCACLLPGALCVIFLRFFPVQAQ